VERGIPYVLKQFIDVVSQPGWIFGVDPVEGYRHLLADRGTRVAVIYTSAVWGPGLGPEFGRDFQSTYFDDWLRWTGLTDVSDIRFHPTLTGDRAAEDAAALARARDFAKTFLGADGGRRPLRRPGGRRPARLLGRGVAVVARHEQALAELDRAAQRRPAGNAGSASRTSSTRRSSQPSATRRRSGAARGGSRAPDRRADDRRRHQRRPCGARSPASRRCWRSGRPCRRGAAGPRRRAGGRRVVVGGERAHLRHVEAGEQLTRGARSVATTTAPGPQRLPVDLDWPGPTRVTRRPVDSAFSGRPSASRAGSAPMPSAGTAMVPSAKQRHTSRTYAADVTSSRSPSTPDRNGRRNCSTTGPSRWAAARSRAALRSIRVAVRWGGGGDHLRGPRDEPRLGERSEQPVGGGRPGEGGRRSGLPNVCSAPSAPRIAAPGTNGRRRSAAQVHRRRSAG
jgi:hypothetical protein